MRKLLRRWYVWLGLVLLLGSAGSAIMVLANPSRINQQRFDRIQDEMSLEDVVAILGEYEGGQTLTDGDGNRLVTVRWESGPNYIAVSFRNDGAVKKHLHLANAREILRWYAKKVAPHRTR
jgi:hypothetical protein